MASRYPSAWLDELRSRSDIVQIVSGYVPLKKSGRKYWGLCPFHGEKTASFSVDAEHQLYYCFGCKAGGNVIHFLMEMERLDFGEAVEALAERAHLPLPAMQNDEDWERRKTQRERLLAANRTAARFYHDTLYRPEGAASLAYLKRRGLTDGVIRRFGLGAAPEDWTRLTDILREEGYTLEELRLAGLTVVKDGEEGKTRSFDMFRGRAVFPIIDMYGNVLGFGGRALGDQQPKYLNTSDTPVFNKRKNVYAANLLKKQRNLERVILVEGYMDVVSLSQFGVQGVCATLGTSLTNEQARLIHRFAPTVHLAYDGDSAGQHAILRGLEIFEQEGIPARVLDFPDGLDPDEFIRRDGPEGFRSLPTLSPAAYRLRRLLDQSDLSTDEGKVAYAKEAAKIIGALDPVEREPYLKQLGLQTGFPRETLMEQVQLSVPASSAASPARRGWSSRMSFRETPAGNTPEDALAAQETLITLLATGQIPKDIVEEKDFEDDELKSLYQGLISGKTVSALIDEAPDDAARSRFARILMTPTAEDTDQLLTMATECVNSLRRAECDRRYQALMEQISSDSCTPEEKQEIFREAQRLKAEKRRLTHA